MAACSCPSTCADPKDSFEIVKYLVEKGANVNAITRKRINALMFAASSGNLQVVKFLLPLSNKFAVDNQGWTVSLTLLLLLFLSFILFVFYICYILCLTVINFEIYFDPIFHYVEYTFFVSFFAIYFIVYRFQLLLSLFLKCVLQSKNYPYYFFC